MNGATADPCVKMIRPPKNSRNRTIGTSQYFLRIRRNAQNSAINDMAVPPMGISKLVLHRFRCRCRRLTCDPVGRKIGTEGERQYILATKTHDPRDWGDA